MLWRGKPNTTEYRVDKGTRGRRRVFVWLLSLALLLLVGALSLIMLLRSPKVAVKLAVGGAVAQLSERPESAALLSYLEESSLTFRLADDHEKNPLLGGFEIGGSLYRSSDAFLAKGLTLRLGEARLAGELYGDATRLYLSERHVLGGGYVLHRGRAVSAFERSILAHGSGSPYALSAEDHEKAVALLRRVDSYATEEIKKEAGEHLLRYVKRLMKAIDRHASFEASAAENARLLTVTLDANALNAILGELAEEMRGDKELQAFLRDHGDAFYGILSRLLTDDESEAPYESILGHIESARQRIRESMTEAVTLSFYTTGLTARLLRMDCSVGEKEIFSLDVGEKGIGRTDSLSLSVGGGTDTWRYTLLGCEEGFFECRLNRHTADGKGQVKSQTLLYLRFDGEERDFSARIGEGAVSLSGQYQREGDSHMLTADRIRLAGLSAGELTFTATLGRDPMPTPIADTALRTPDTLTEAHADAIRARLKETEDGLPAIVALFLDALV